MKNNLQFLESKYETLIKDQESRDDVSYYTGAMLLLGGLLVITILGIFIKDNYSVRLLVFIGILFISLLTYRSKISMSAQKSETSKTNHMGDQAFQLKHRLQVLKNTLNSKKARVAALEWFYIVNFPIYLFSIQEFISGPMSNEFLLWSILISFLIGIIVWRLYFSGDRNRIVDHELTVTQMINELN